MIGKAVSILDEEIVLTQTPPGNKIRIEYLDGIRGLAALYVVIYHAHRSFAIQGPTPINSFFEKFLHYTYQIFGQGRLAVVVFIVLSGYSLMLPIIKSEGFTFSKGIFDYFKRRFRRIIPPYYTALLISFLLIIVIPGMNNSGPPISEWDAASPAFNLDTIMSHLLLIHNWNLDWMYKINPPMWSVPIEFQIYFLFPFLLLPLWKKFNNWTVLIVSLVLGLVPVFLFPEIRFTSIWMLSLFTIGMISASINFSNKPSDVKLRYKIHWGKISLLLFPFAAVIIFLNRRVPNLEFEPLVEIVVGFAIAFLLIYLTEISKKSATNIPGYKLWVINILQSRPLLLLGSFSYSLYLIHDPILGCISKLCIYFNISSGWSYFLVFAVGLPLALGAAYIFYLLVERHFLSSNKKYSKLRT